MRFTKEIRPALLIVAFLLLLGIAGEIYSGLYSGATPKSRQRLAFQHLDEESVQFVEERVIADGGFILWLYEENGHKGVATFTQSKEDVYYFSGYRLNYGNQPSSFHLYDMDFGSYQVLLFDRPDLDYMEYEIYLDENLWRAERLDAEQLMVIESPTEGSFFATYTFYDKSGKSY